MVKTKSNELVETAGVLPEYLRGADARLHDNFDETDVVIPQIRLLQGASEVVTTFAEAQPGKFWHTGFDTDLGDTFDFIVCSRRKKYLLVAPMDDGQGVLARADDAKTWDHLGEWNVKVDKKTVVKWEITDLNVEASGLTKWGSYDPTDSNSPPAATLFYEYLVILPDHLDLGPAVISLARTSIKKAKRGLNDKIALHSQAGRPMQSLKFQAKVVTDSNDSGQDFFVWQFAGSGFASEDLYRMARGMADTLRTYSVQGEGEQERAGGADSDAF